MKSKFNVKILSFVMLVGAAAMATDPVAQQEYTAAQALYAQRADATKVTQALTTLADAETQAVNTDLKYDIMVLESMTLYWQGMQATTNSQKVTLFDQGRAKAQAASAINDTTDTYAEGYYWAAANLGRWGESNGVIASLSQKDTLIALAGAIPNKITRDGQAGETYEGYGSDRIMGRMLFELPSFAGGSLTDSVNDLQTAYQNAPNYALNVEWYAESLASGTPDQVAQAKQILKTMLAQNPNTLNPARIPETIQEFADSQKLLQQLGN